METLKTLDVPADIAPVPASRRARPGNQFLVRQSFPFGSYDTIPTLSVVLENIALSVGTVIASTAGLLVTTTVFLPLGILKSTGNLLSWILGFGRGAKSQSKDWIKRRRCIVINGASSGIGATLVREYASADAHLVLIARDLERLNHLKHDAESVGATVSVHSLEFFEGASSLNRLRSLLHEIDSEYKGIDVAICCIGVTGHRGDVIGREDASKAHDARNIATESLRSVVPTETGLEWGATAAERIVQVNISAFQTFTLTCWALMRARRLQNPSAPSPSIVLLGSSAAFFFPANFVLYSASKSYIYSLGQALRVLSMPYGIRVTTVCPGFIESGMTHTMLQTGSTTPVAVLGNPEKLSKRVKKAEEANEGVVFYPFSQAGVLFAARALNPLLETLGMWVGSATGMASYQMS